MKEQETERTWLEEVKRNVSIGTSRGKTWIPLFLKLTAPPRVILFSVMLFSSCPSSSFPSSRGGRRGQKRWGIRARAAKNCMDTRGGRGRQREGGGRASVVVTQRSQCVRDGPITKPVRQSMRRGVARTRRGVIRTVRMWHG